MKKDLLYKLLFLSCLIVGYSMVYKTEATTVRTNPSSKSNQNSEVFRIFCGVTLILNR